MRADTTQLLELLREAGDEAVTLDELAIVGVRNPARALRELEEAGHAVQRVHERPARGRAVICVRLAGPSTEPARPAPVAQPPVAQPPVAQPPVAQPPVAQPPVAQPPVAQPPVAQRRGRRRLLAAIALGVLLVVGVRALSGRRR
jgi:hypothetical protein